tara:strand:+ start:1519 stop:2106 length:588 start_codon:yes stop_codon:yes gene_type:complete
MTLKSNGYLVLNKIISADVAKVLAQKTIDKIKNDKPINNEDRGLCWALYKPVFMKNLMKEVKIIIEGTSKVKLLPTYWFTTIYTNNSFLKPHIDRPSCEYSVSLNLKSNIDWPLFFKDKNNNNKGFITKVGDGIAYFGCERPHWRLPLVSKNRELFIQTFFHYVDANGPYKSFANDNGKKYQNLSKVGKITELHI